MTTSNDISTPKKAESAPRQALELLKRLWQQEQYVRVRLETERDSEARAAGLGQPVMVAYHRQMITHHEGELRTLKWLIEAAQEQEVELAALRAQAEAEAGLREAVAQLMSDPWSYHKEGRRCIDCSALRGDDHFDGCAVVKIAAALAQAGGESL